jgi:DNA-binding IclR family transcriptional regulator
MGTLQKTIAILNSFSPDKPELTASAIADNLKMPRPTVYRILSTLTKSGLLEKKPGKGTYVIGRNLYTMGSLYLNTTDLYHAAEPVIQAINDITGEVTNVAILDDKGYITMILREESKHPLRHVVHVGSSAPAYTRASGKALLSALTDEEIDRLYPEEKLEKMTSKTVATRTELKLEMEQARKNGFAFNSEQGFEGIEAVSSVIRNARGNVIAAVAISAPVVRMNKEKRKRFASLIKIGAGLISYRLGYQDEAHPVHQVEDLYIWWQQNQYKDVSQSNIKV